VTTMLIFLYLLQLTIILKTTKKGKGRESRSLQRKSND